MKYYILEKVNIEISHFQKHRRFFPDNHTLLGKQETIFRKSIHLQKIKNIRRNEFLVMMETFSLTYK